MKGFTLISLKLQDSGMIPINKGEKRHPDHCLKKTRLCPILITQIPTNKGLVHPEIPILPTL